MCDVIIKMQLVREEEERLRAYERFRSILDRPAEHGWRESSTSFLAYESLSDEMLLEKAYTFCDDCSWDKKWDCSSFHAIMRDGSLCECFVSEKECLADALKRMPELPTRVIHEAFQGGGAGASIEDGYIETTTIRSHRLGDEDALRARLEALS
jgi:hypothetical protein